MRIRKQSQKLACAECPPADIPLTSVGKGTDWSFQEVSSKIDHGTLQGEEVGLDADVNSGQQAVAAVEDNVDPGHDTVEQVRLSSQPWIMFKRGKDNVGKDKGISLEEQVELQEKSKTPRVRKNKTPMRSSMSGFLTRGYHSFSKTEEIGARERSLSLSWDTRAAKVDQTRSIRLSESGSLGKSMQINGIATRHYVRRSLRNSEDGTSQVQSEESFRNEATVPASRIPSKTGIHTRNQSEFGQSCHLGQKTEPRSPGATRKIKLARIDSCHANEDHAHPSSAPEGSLLHSLYLQLLVAGREGLTLRELFASFVNQMPRLSSNWREQLKSQLKRNFHFTEVRGHYFLCEQLEQRPPKKAAKRDATCSVKESFGISPHASPVKPSPKIHIQQPDFGAQPGASALSSHEPPVDTDEGVQTRRKAYQKTIDAVLNESAIEFQRMQEKKVNVGDMATKTAALKGSSQLSSPKKRNVSAEDENFLYKNVRYGGASPGALRAMQERIVSEYGEQNGVRCARKDGCKENSKWQCPLMAMEGRNLCEHHNFLNDKKKARYNAKGGRKGKRRPRQSLHMNMRELETAGARTKLMHDVGCMSRPGAEMSHSDTEEIAGLDAAGTSQLLLSMKSGLPVENDTLISPNHVEVMEESTDEKSEKNCENRVPHISRNAPKRRYVAAKKTAVNSPHTPAVKKSKEKHVAPLIRPPTIPPLPAFNGMRKKLVKNRSLLTL